MMKFVVVGGGTAGWLTALYVKKNIPYSRVTVIASSEIGILGAGEGTNWDFLEFLNEIDVPVDGVIKHARGTFKNGIKFTNWNGDGEYYYHPFQDHLGRKPNAEFDPIPLYLDKVSKGQTLSDIQFTTVISEKNKVKYNADHQSLGVSALHFDANLLAEYLQSVGVSRSIEFIDDEVVDFETKKNGDITQFNLKSGNTCDADFVFDCSGFKRLIIGNHYKSSWKSYAPSLPVNRAVPFFIDNDSTNIPPYTESIAMKYGWMWKIPVQGRFGCGYVFDSRLASDEDIKKELTEYLGFEPTIPRIFDFEPGAYEQVWINNCVAIGLSAGFVEPLEATSIQVTTFGLRALSTKLQGMMRDRKRAVEEFNYEMKRINDHILNFIYFHYLSTRSDTEFWTKFKERNALPDFVTKFADMSKKTFIKPRDFDYLDLITQPSKMQSKNPFSIFSWHMVGAGIKFFKANIAERELDSYKKFDPTTAEPALKELLETVSDTAMDHNEYIEYLKSL